MKPKISIKPGPWIPRRRKDGMVEVRRICFSVHGYPSIESHVEKEDKAYERIKDDQNWPISKRRDLSEINSFFFRRK